MYEKSFTRSSIYFTKHSKWRQKSNKKGVYIYNKKFYLHFSDFLLLTKNNKVCIKMHYSTYVQLQSFEKLILFFGFWRSNFKKGWGVQFTIDYTITIKESGRYIPRIVYT